MDGLGQSGLDIWARLLDSDGNPTGAVPLVLDVAPSASGQKLDSAPFVINDDPNSTSAS